MVTIAQAQPGRGPPPSRRPALSLPTHRHGSAAAA